MPTGTPRDLDIAEISRRYEAGESTREIARALGTNHMTVQHHMAQAGIARRERVAAVQIGTAKRPAPPPKRFACQQCGGPILSGDHPERQRFCSRACYGRYRHDHNMGGPPPKPVPTFELECRSCGTPFIVRGKEGERRAFCSHPCAMKYNHQRRWGATVPERIVQALLTGLGIRFEVEWSLGGRRADLYLPDYHVAIECDGDYWHSLDYSQRAASRKAADFAAAGIPVLHLTETQIREDLSGCKAAIEALIRRQ